ncbi:hypothetical protein V6N12_042227 [Hibiscus sabdariffa]|uniref:Uncharacterized protein n=1 Tax=Hibiscus sabdariffa TaxID=183260 RepID=A0ABR2EE62_9ROSI
MAAAILQDLANPILLNAVKGPDGSAIGAWNSSNAESIMRYTVNKGYTIHGWELGNELCGSGIGAKIAADQYAADVNSLQNITDNIYKGFEVKPLVIAPGGFIDTNWFTQFVQKTPKSLQVVTQHIYNLGPGNDNQLMNKILDPSYQDGGGQPFSDLQAILKSSSTSAVAWVGEAGGAYNSGQNHVSNSFVNSFCALLWHRLMGSNVLSTSFYGSKSVRAYAHCSKQSQGITLLLINFSANTTVRVQVGTEGSAINGSLSLQQGRGVPRLNFARMSTKSKMNGKSVREEYHLTPKDGNLQSQSVVLNGKRVALNSSGGIPHMEPVSKSMLQPIIVAPSSIVFSHIPSIILPACKN